MSAEIDKKMQGSVSRPIRSFFSVTMPLTGFEISVGGVLSIPVVAGLTFIGFKSWGEKTLDSSKLKPKKPAPATTAVAKKATPAKKSGPEQTSATVKTTITEKTTDTDNKPATDKTTAAGAIDQEVGWLIKRFLFVLGGGAAPPKKWWFH